MINREKLIALMSRDISDSLNVPNDVLTEKAASETLRTVYINVVLPMLDMFEHDDRQVHRHLQINQVRDLIVEPQEPEPSAEEQKKNIKVDQDH
jgi:hypothetical protein